MVDKLEKAKERDRNKIAEIRSKWNLDKIEDVEKVLGLLQTGSIWFETETGRAFDDELYDRKLKLEGGHTSSAAVRGKKKNAGAANKKDKREVHEKSVRKERNRKLIMSISICVAVLSLGYFTYYCYQAYKSGREFEALSELKNSDFSLYRKAKVTLDAPEDAPDILEEYITLYNKNKSLIGWLKIDDTIIDYPVMQSSNESYYLTHNFNQEKDNNGSLFIDADCSIWPRSQNIIVYGHNMKSGKMFGSLSKYKSEDYFKKHPVIQFDTLYEKGEYQVMYVFSEIVHDEAEVAFRYYQFINVNSEEEYDSNMEQMKEMSLYDTGVVSKYGDELLTLSTCDYTEGAERFAVVAKRID